MNNKLLSAVLVAWIAVTGFAWMSSADETNTGSTKGQFEKVKLTDAQIAEKEAIKAIMEKKRDWETLTSEETASIESFIANNPRGDKKDWKRWDGKSHSKNGWKMGKNLTDEEKTALESMNDEDKKAFFETKKAEAKEKKEASKAIIEKIIAWTTLTSDEEVTRLEIVAKMETKEQKSERKSKRSNSDIFKKVINLETLTDEEKETLLEMKAKKEERTAAKEVIAPIFEKKKAWTELTEDEESQLEAFKIEYKSDKKDHWNKGEKRGNRGNKTDK